MKLAIIILNYKKYDYTINCINSILKFKKDFYIFVIDNNSNNNSLENIKKEFSFFNPSILDYNEFNNENFICRNLNLIQSSTNLGYAKGNNIGIELCKKGNFDYIAVLNNDILLVDDIFTKMISFINKNISTNFKLFGPLLEHPDGTIDYNCAKKTLTFTDLIAMTPIGSVIKRSFNYFIGFKQKNTFFFKDTLKKEVDIISGSFMLFRKDLFNEIDGFDPNTFLYFEEPILCSAIKEKKHKVLFLPDFKAIHHHGATTSSISRVFQLQETRKSMNYYVKNYSKINKIQLSLINVFFYFSIRAIKIKAKFKKNNSLALIFLENGVIGLFIFMLLILIFYKN